MRALEWLVVALLGLAFVPAALALAGVWSKTDYYAHGFFVPMVSLWLVARRGRVGSVN